MSNAGAPKNNTNAEKWTIEAATETMTKAVELSRENEYDFIGEVAKEMGTYHEVFTYLKDKFDELKPLHKELLSNCETNCFSNGKKGSINTAMAIVNLKSNHGWTDRVERVSENINHNTEISKEEVQDIRDKLKDKY